MSYPEAGPMDSLPAAAGDDFFDAIERKGCGADNERAKALGMRVIAYDARETEAGRALGVEYVSLDERFARSDVLGLRLCRRAPGGSGSASSPPQWPPPWRARHDPSCERKFLTQICVR